jgi:hypothetical protein
MKRWGNFFIFAGRKLNLKNTEEIKIGNSTTQLQDKRIKVTAQFQ